MHTRSARGRGGPISEINLTPLVDVMLVLLIIFMIAAPMITAGIPVDLPSAAGQPLDHEREETLVTVLADGRVLLFREELSLSELRERLLHDPRLRANEEVFLQADRAIPYGEVIRVIALFRSAGIPRVGLVTDPAGEAEPEELGGPR